MLFKFFNTIRGKNRYTGLTMYKVIKFGLKLKQDYSWVIHDNIFTWIWVKDDGIHAFLRQVHFRAEFY